MGFFKEFKDDLSQAVNELLPEEGYDDDLEVNTLDDKETLSSDAEEEEDSFEDDNVDQDILDAILIPDEEEDAVPEELAAAQTDEKEDEIPDKKTEENIPEENTADAVIASEVTVITKGTVINGSISADGSLEVMGTIKGDVECQGKLSILGNVSGNSIAAEIYVGAKRLEGSINSEGSVKIGLGSVVLGDVTGVSAVIAGAVKGEIDVNGPVIIDSSAVIKGNIKAQSIQINNGAVIEGYCSLAYASIDIDNIFE